MFKGKLLASLLLSAGLGVVGLGTAPGAEPPRPKPQAQPGLQQPRPGLQLQPGQKPPATLQRPGQHPGGLDDNSACDSGCNNGCLPNGKPGQLNVQPGQRPVR